MKDILDGEEKGAKLDVLKELLGLSRSAMKGKLPKKGKGVSIMSISVSKPKGPETAEEVAMPEEKPAEGMEKELPEELPEDMKELVMSGKHPAEAEAEEEVPEHEAEESEEEEELESELPEPKVPSDVMELVKLMLQRKLQK